MDFNIFLSSQFDYGHFSNTCSRRPSKKYYYQFKFLIIFFSRVGRPTLDCPVMRKNIVDPNVKCRHLHGIRCPYVSWFLGHVFLYRVSVRYRRRRTHTISMTSKINNPHTPHEFRQPDRACDFCRWPMAARQQIRLSRLEIARRRRSITATMTLNSQQSANAIPPPLRRSHRKRLVYTTPTTLSGINERPSLPRDPASAF